MSKLLEGIHSNFKAMRRTGYTTNLLDMCKEKNCNLIVANITQLQYLKDKYPEFKCITLDQHEKIRGIQEPFYLDNSALEVILHHWEEAERNHAVLIVEHDELKKRNNMLFDEFVALRKQIIDEQEKNRILAEQIKEIEKLANRSLFRKILDGLKRFF